VLSVKVYDDELNQSALPVPEIEPSTLIKNVLKDSAKLFADNINTPVQETLKNDITGAFKSIIPVLEKANRKVHLNGGNLKMEASLTCFQLLHSAGCI
jgi:hypothetical protein